MFHRHIANQEISGLRAANVITYSAIISCCEKTSAWPNALLLLQDLKRGYGPVASNLVTYNAAMAACEKGTQWLEAHSSKKGSFLKSDPKLEVNLSVLLSSQLATSRWFP